MARELLNYIMPVAVITPTPAASTGFLKEVCFVVKPKVAVPVGIVTPCTTTGAIAALTANEEAFQVLAAGKSRVFILPSNDLDLADALEEYGSEFFSAAISSDFDGDFEDVSATGNVTITSYANLVDAGNDTISVAGVAFVAGSGSATPGDATFQAASSNNSTALSLAAQINAHPVASLLVEAEANSAIVTITAVQPGAGGNAIALSYTDGGTATVGATVSGETLSGGEHSLDLGTWKGVVYVQGQNDEWLEDQAAIANRCAFKSSVANKGKNMGFAVGSLLANALNWRNQQYITMPFSDGIDILGDANALFDENISFVFDDADFGKRLALFACGGKAIVAPYVIENVKLNLQSRFLQYVSGNQPAYTRTNASLIQDYLQDEIDLAISRRWIESGSIQVKVENDNFVLSGYINIPDPKAVWRMYAELTQI